MCGNGKKNKLSETNQKTALFDQMPSFLVKIAIIANMLAIFQQGANY